MKKDILTATQVCELLCVSHSTLWRYTRSGIVPKPQKKANGYSTFWYKSDIEEVKKNNIF